MGSGMPRYSFTVVAGNERFEDPAWAATTTLAQAHAHALGLIERVVALAPERSEGRGWLIEVEENGRNMLTVLFPRHRPSTGLRRRQADGVPRDALLPPLR